MKIYYERWCVGVGVKAYCLKKDLGLLVIMKGNSWNLLMLKCTKSEQNYFFFHIAHIKNLSRVKSG